MSEQQAGLKAKKRMQNVKFQTVEQLLDFLPEDELKITEVLRRIVCECIPDVQKKLSFNLPFYKRKTMICFI